jgi:hypothetical protein
MPLIHVLINIFGQLQDGHLQMFTVLTYWMNSRMKDICT